MTCLYNKYYKTQIRALKMHGGGPKVTPGKPLHPDYKNEVGNIDLEFVFLLF